MFSGSFYVSILSFCYLFAAGPLWGYAQEIFLRPTLGRVHMYVRSLGECLVAHFMYRSLVFVICLQRVLYEDMPTKFFFDLLRETDQDFVDRTGWFYRHDQPLYIPSPCVLVQPPHLPEGSRPFSPAAPSVFPSPFPSPNGNWDSCRLTFGSMTTCSTSSTFGLIHWFNDSLKNLLYLWRVRF